LRIRHREFCDAKPWPTRSGTSPKGKGLKSNFFWLSITTVGLTARIEQQCL
jgi:hypothetical protein